MYLEILSASRQPLELDGAVPFFVIVEHLANSVRLGVTECSAPNVLLGMVFIDKCIEGRFPHDRTLMRRQSIFVSILDDQEKEYLGIKVYTAVTEDNEEYPKVTVVYQVTLPAGSNCQVLVRTYPTRYRTIDRRPILRRDHGVLLANRFIKMVFDEPIYILVPGTSSERMHVLRNMYNTMVILCHHKLIGCENKIVTKSQIATVQK